MKHLFFPLILFFLLITSCSQAERSEDDCSINSGSCSYRIKGTDVVLDITPKPVKTMTELEFTVWIRPLMTEPPQGLLLDLEMPRMKMGENRIVLQRTSTGIYRGKGIIVKCPSGRKDWKATVWVPGLGEAKYLFSVK